MTERRRQGGERDRGRDAEREREGEEEVRANQSEHGMTSPADLSVVFSVNKG